MQRPRDLTRQQLKELRLLLDSAGYSEATLRAAWRDATNEDIAASIIVFIRQAALGDALIPYPERVDRAMNEEDLGKTTLDSPAAQMAGAHR